MTPEELRKMDAEIHQKVMGLRCEYDSETGDWYDTEPHNFGGGVVIPHYSTDIAAAWEVANWLRERRGQFFLCEGYEWHCYSTESREPRPPEGSGETPMLAICKAALAVTQSARN